jgi:hydrogenase-1 operon protein HyaF
MVSNFQLPPQGFGPGSQPADTDGDIAWLPMPSGMRTYAPHLPDIADARAAQGALDLLARIAGAADAAAQGEPGTVFETGTLSPAARALLTETLGEGEVSLKARGIPAIAAQESVFAGVWSLAGAGIDRVEVASVPAIALSRAFLAERPAIGPLARRRPGVVNAPALLAELLDRSARFAPGGPPHVVNLTLLPHTEDDLLWLDEALGLGSVTLLSRGYGNCRIAATALPHVWRVQFFNSMDTLILDTFEVTAMPETARAAPEDLADSAARIREVLEALS